MKRTVMRSRKLGEDKAETQSIKLLNRWASECLNKLLCSQMAKGRGIDLIVGRQQ